MSGKSGGLELKSHWHLPIAKSNVHRRTEKNPPSSILHIAVKFCGFPFLTFPSLPGCADHAKVGPQADV